MKVITFKNIEDLSIAPTMCSQWVNKALLMKRDAMLPKKISLSPESPDHVFYNTMPCLIPQVNRGGVKLVTRYPNRNPSIDSEILLYDLSNGECLALLDGDWITTMRTGAVAAHSINLLKRPGARKIAIAGLGNTAIASLLCLADDAKGPDYEVGLLKYKDQHLRFQQRFADFDNLTFQIFDNPTDMAEWCDIFLSCITATDNDLVTPDAFRPGALVVPVHTRGFTQCDLAFDKIFCDDASHVSSFKYYPLFKDKLTEVASVVSGNAPGRESNDERILAYNIGIALHDIFFATQIEKLMRGKGEGVITLDKPHDKFWV